MIASPIAINFLLNGGVVMSFIYTPLLCLFFAIFSIYVDKKLLSMRFCIKSVKVNKQCNEEEQVY